LQQSLSGMRYIHYAPTHVLYNHRKIDPTCCFTCCSSDSLRALSSFTRQCIYRNGARAEASSYTAL